MTHIFVSYSRKDIDFAGKIVHELAEKNLDTWIDWKSIPKGEFWEQEIYRGIEGADVFLFLMSPDSVHSEMCNKEIAHAVKNSKRLLPVVIRDADTANFHAEISSQEISKRNWIFCRDGLDNFSAAIGEMLTAIHTEFVWLRYHTGLQVKALEWERSGHKSGFLLHGEELGDAEVQLVTNSSKEPYPTYLQREYVLRSRQATDRARRRIITGLIGFLVIVMGLLIFSLVQLNISRARQLGSLAQAAFAQQDYNTALLYAYQADQIYENDASDLILSQIAYENFDRPKALVAHDVHSLAWSADGQLASGSDNGTVFLWALNSGQPTQTLQGHRGWVNSIAWSADGQLASGLFATVIVWDLKTTDSAQTLQAQGGSITSVAWSVEGQLASGSQNGTIFIWDLDTSQPAQILQGPRVESVAWSVDGQLASASGDRVIIWNLDTGQPAKTLQGHGGWVNSIAWSTNGQLASGSYDGTVIVWDLKTSEPALIFHGHGGRVNSVDWSPDGQLASGSDDDTVIVWDLGTRQPVHILQGHNDRVIGVDWSADGKLASGSDDDTVIVWDLNISESAQTLQEQGSSITSVAWAANGQLASGSDAGTVIIWDLDTLQPSKMLGEQGGSITSVAWSVDGQLASGSQNGTVIVWDLDKQQPGQILQGQEELISSVTWSPDGHLALGSNDGTVIIWDPNTSEPSRILRGHQASVTSVAWSANGQLASGAFDDTVIIWNLDTGQPAKTLQGHEDYVESVAWSANGQLASGSSDGTVIVWDLKTSEPAQILHAYETSTKVDSSAGEVTSIAWSANGRLASGLFDGTVVIWDLDRGQPDHILKGRETSVLSVILSANRVNSLAWSANGKLASGSNDRTIKITWNAFDEGLCSRIFRNMTLSEWADSQGPFFTYQPACSNLYDPTTNPSAKDILHNDLALAFITWRGRAFLTGLLISYMSVVSVILWATRSSAKWSRRRISRKKAKPS